MLALIAPREVLLRIAAAPEGDFTSVFGDLTCICNTETGSALFQDCLARTLDERVAAVISEEALAFVAIEAGVPKTKAMVEFAIRACVTRCKGEAGIENLAARRQVHLSFLAFAQKQNL